MFILKLLATMFVAIIMTLSFVGFSHARYNPQSGSIYTCNEGYTPKLCRERENQRIKLYKLQKRLNLERDIIDNKKKK